MNSSLISFNRSGLTSIFSRYCKSLVGNRSWAIYQLQGYLQCQQMANDEEILHKSVQTKDVCRKGMYLCQKQFAPVAVVQAVQVNC